MQHTEAVNSTMEDGGRQAGPCAVVIFGASGDLTKRKLIPALSNLAQEKLLPSSFAIVGVATRPWSQEDFRAKVNEALDQFATDEVSSEFRQWLSERLV